MSNTIKSTILSQNNSLNITESTDSTPKYNELFNIMFNVPVLTRALMVEDFQESTSTLSISTPRAGGLKYLNNTVTVFSEIIQNVSMYLK